MLPRLLRLLASRSTALLNFADLSRSIGLPQTTLQRYMALLEMTFLLQTLTAWFVNIGKRLAKSSKLLRNDTGLATHLQGLNAERLVDDRVLLGPLLENFVIMELKKQAGWSRRQPQLHDFRTEAGEEVDVVLEDASGRDPERHARQGQGPVAHVHCGGAAECGGPVPRDGPTADLPFHRDVLRRVRPSGWAWASRRPLRLRLPRR